MSHDELIFGKNEIQGITSIEPEGDQMVIFREDQEPICLPNKYWMVSPVPLGKKSARLKGDLYYKYGIQFSDRELFEKMRYMWKKHDVFSIFNPSEAAMIKDGYTYYKGMKHTDVSVLSWDIETTGLNHDHTAKLLIISNTFRKKGQISRRLFSYDQYSSEGEMIDDWCQWVRQCDPSVVIGHNIYGYDLPYMQFLATRAGTELRLGKDGRAIEFAKYESKFRKDGSQFLHYHKPHVYGRELVDTMFLAIKYDVGRKYESYALKKIISQEGLEVQGRQHYDAATIRDNYMVPEEWAKIKLYALHDADDALALFDLMIPPFFYLTQTVPKSFQLMIESASGSQINAVMMRAYLQQAHSLPKASEAVAYEGAISHGIPGVYRNAFKIDVASLYPSIMIEYEVCDPEKDPLRYFPHLVKTFTEKRLYHKSLAKKDKYHDDLQAAYKIFINSSYGFLGTNGLLFNSPANAAFITTTGRNILRTAIEWAESKSYEQWLIDNGIADERLPDAAGNESDASELPE